MISPRSASPPLCDGMPPPTASPHSSRKFLQEFLGEVKPRDIETRDGLTGTQHDRFFDRKQMQLARQQLAAQRPPVSFVASPILGRPSMGSQRSVPLSSQPVSRRELSRTLTGELSPLRRLGPFSPGRERTNRLSRGGIASLKPVMRVGVGTHDIAGGRTAGRNTCSSFNNPEESDWWPINNTSSLTGNASVAEFRSRRPGKESSSLGGSISVPPPSMGEYWVEYGEFCDSKRSSMFRAGRIQVSTPVSPLRPISRSRHAFARQDRYTAQASVGRATTPAIMR